MEASVLHALWHVDEVIVADHRSTDGTREILEGLPVTLVSGPLVEARGFDGDRIWTWLAKEALARGHEWMVVTDADDIWHVTGDPDARIKDYLRDLIRPGAVVSAGSFNHIPTGADDADEANPVLRIGWRAKDSDAVKVACQLRPDLSYSAHNAWYGGRVALPTVTRGLTVRHFTIRTADQLVTKIRNGMDAFSVEAGMPPGFDWNWAQWQGMTDAEIRAAFFARFWVDTPATDGALVYDPAPWAGARA